MAYRKQEVNTVQETQVHRINEKVMILGVRQTGKTTQICEIARRLNIPVVTATDVQARYISRVFGVDAFAGAQNAIIGRDAVVIDDIERVFGIFNWKHEMTLYERQIKAFSIDINNPLLTDGGQ